jgi:hypothetical protein
MATAYYPLGMRQSMPASGYNHNSTYYQKQYIPWKGTGAFSNPVGTAAGHIRPLTNKDPGNVFQTGFGLPRPIKHYRKGRVIPTQINNVDNLVNNNPYDSSIVLNIDETALINYNMNRYVASSKGTSLGGGFGGSGLLNEMQDKPGSYIIRQNPPNELSSVEQLNENCKTCEGVGIVATYYPNPTYLTDNPEPNVVNPVLCCNQEYKAKRRAIYASTNLKPNYYTTTKQYLQNRCKTFEQKSFNFLSTKWLHNNPISKPGSPSSLTNVYLANCQPNAEIYYATETALINQMLGIMLKQNIITIEEETQFNSSNINTIDGFFNWINTLPEPQRQQAINVFEVFINNPYSGMPLSGPSNPAGCQLVVYKPNNYQYANQGAVSSSTRILKLDVDTISTNSASLQNYNNTGGQLVTANQLYAGVNNNYANLFKNKPSTTGCVDYPLNFKQSGRFQNKKFCYYNSLPQYQMPLSQPSPYRYFPGTYKSSNHYSQSPNTYNTTTGVNAF